MATDIVKQGDGSASITVSTTEATGLRSIAAQHLPFLKKAAAWFDADVAPELKEAADFLETLASGPAQNSLTLSASELGALRGMLVGHIPDFQQVLAVVDSPAVLDMLKFARTLL